MAELHNFKFDNMTRLGEDHCGLSERDIQNTKYGNYFTQNYFSHLCGDRKLVDMATSQPNVFFKDGVGDCNIGDETTLRGQGDVKHPGRIMLVERPYLSVPYLGKGSSKPDIESMLLMGTVSTLKKDAKVLTEKGLGNEKVDLVPSLQKTIQNPSNLVEGEALDGWIRGGLPTRDLTRSV